MAYNPQKKHQHDQHGQRGQHGQHGQHGQQKKKKPGNTKIHEEKSTIIIILTKYFQFST